jgi:hypothetical protein
MTGWYEPEASPPRVSVNSVLGSVRIYCVEANTTDEARYTYKCVCPKITSI